MKNYNLLNILFGWFAFLVALIVYVSTLEPTASFWDCGEYIATAYKLQVGHPPGAPFFQLLGRFFSLFAFGDVMQVAYMINFMSALMSALTILFLFWTISYFAKRIFNGYKNGLSVAQGYAVLGSALIGALAYTFSDSFWFSAVEGEVYASSSFFTAVTFWAVLRWERVSEKPSGMKWIILIFYLIGISIGVHLLNLLAIPAVLFIYYFKKYKPTRWGVIFSLIISVVLLGVILYIIVPYIVKLAGGFEIFFVNTIGLPFNSGTIIFFATLTVLIIFGLHYTRKRKLINANVIILSFTFLLIGYMSFFILVIRTHANTPIDENNPEDAVSLLSYLNREQYGTKPLIYGQNYNAPQTGWKDGTPVYKRDDEKGKYIIIDDRKNSIPIYDPKYSTVFPRMWSADENRRHISTYKQWAGIENDPENRHIPTLGENIKFFIKYQVGFMYFRYFMWNFAGRQNNIQGYGGPLNGNWISGINFLDEMRLGPQKDIPPLLQDKAGRNKFYMLPLILGLLGLFFHFSVKRKDAFVVFLLFFFTGLAIVIYINQHPNQPRERDYAYAASFYAFAVWIGLGVISLFRQLSKKINAKTAAILASAISLLLVPSIMAKEGWDDHDRSGRYTARDFARNYLTTCAENAIIFTHGDNDTFPVWYVQEVEGYRTDVRVIVMTLFNTGWNVDQMKRKVYESDPLPFSMDLKQYQDGTRDYVLISENPSLKGYTDLKKVMEFVASDDMQTKLPVTSGRQIDYFPTKSFYIPVDSAKVIENGTVSQKNADKIVDRVEWKISGRGMPKGEMMLLDLIAHFNWDRPIYFAVSGGNSAYMGLNNYLQLEGLAYRLVPIKSKGKYNAMGRIDTELMYDNLMNKYQWGNMSDPDVYLDATNLRQIQNVQNIRELFGQLAMSLADESKEDSVLLVCDRCLEILPDSKIPFDYRLFPIVESYYRIDATDKAKMLLNQIIDNYAANLKYFNSFPLSKKKSLEMDIQQALAVMQNSFLIAEKYEDAEIANRAKEIFENYYQLY